MWLLIFNKNTRIPTQQPHSTFLPLTYHYDDLRCGAAAMGDLVYLLRCSNTCVLCSASHGVFSFAFAHVVHSRWGVGVGRWWHHLAIEKRMWSKDLIGIARKLCFSFDVLKRGSAENVRRKREIATTKTQDQAHNEEQDKDNFCWKK